MSAHVPLADRQLARDTVAELQSIIDRIRTGQVPRWVLIGIASHLATAARIVHGVNREHDCGTSKCVVTIHDCIESGCIGEKAAQP